jgi:hypothetical protein
MPNTAVRTQSGLMLSRLRDTVLLVRARRREIVKSGRGIGYCHREAARSLDQPFITSRVCRCQALPDHELKHMHVASALAATTSPGLDQARAQSRPLHVPGYEGRVFGQTYRTELESVLRYRSDRCWSKSSSAALLPMREMGPGSQPHIEGRSVRGVPGLSFE